MEKVLNAVYQNDEKLPYLALQRKVGMLNDTFRKCIKVLRRRSILEEPSSKNKKTPIRFTPDAKSKAPALFDLHNTYLSPNEIRKKEKKLQWKVIRTSRKGKQEIKSVRSSIIMQYFLIRAEYGTYYRMTVTNRKEQGQAGLITLYEDRRHHKLYSPDVKDSMAEKQKEV